VVAVVAIMLLGHWLEIRAIIGLASGALAALVELLPDDPSGLPTAAAPRQSLLACKMPKDVDMGDDRFYVLSRPPSLGRSG
jgi:hypothetical protein